MADFNRLRRYLALPSRSSARIRRDVDDELQLQIDMRAEALEREGMSPQEARAEAIRKFGDLEDAAHYCAAVDRDAERQRRRSSLSSELLQDANHTLRTLRRSPAFGVATVLTLAVAIGASTAVYGVLQAYFLRPLPFPTADRLVSIGGRPQRGGPRAPSLENVDWTQIDSLFETTVVWDVDGFTISGKHHAETITGAWVSRAFFPTLGLRMALGREFHPDEYRDPAPVAIISHDLWVRHFAGDSGVIGSTVAVHSAERPNAASRVTIVGVMPRDFWPLHWRESELLRPLPPGRHLVPSLARLRPGVARVETERRLDAALRAQIAGDVDPAWRMRLIPAIERHSAPVRPVLAVVSGAALFMLLAACGSVAGALVSRMASRRSELAVRLALGGSRARIVRQLLTESAVLATLAGTLGIVTAYVLVDATGTLIERSLGTGAPGGAAALRPTISTMMLCMAVSALVGVALGLIPAMTFLRFDRAAAWAVLGSGRSGSTRGGGARVRKILIAGQVMVAMVLLFGAGLMFRTIAHMAATDVGFRASGVMAGSMLLPESGYPDSASKRQLIERVLERVARTGGVRHVAAVFPPPFGWEWRLPVSAADGVVFDQETMPSASVFTVSADYFKTMEIGIRAGRTFRPSDDAAAPLVVVISEGLARRLSPNGDAVGRRIRVRVPYLASFDDRDELPWRTVIGVVGDTKKEFAADVLPDVYVPYSQNPRSLQAIVVRSERPEQEMVEPVKRAVASVDPGLALFDVGSMTNAIAAEVGQRRGLTVLLAGFAVFALGLSALALYASLSYSVTQRRSELAVRIAVGADTTSILRLVLGEALVSTGIGAAGGAVASLALGRVLQAQVYGVGTGDPATLVTIALVLAVAAVGACFAPVLRALRTDAALVLRDL